MYTYIIKNTYVYAQHESVHYDMYIYYYGTCIVMLHINKCSIVTRV